MKERDFWFYLGSGILCPILSIVLFFAAGMVVETSNVGWIIIYSVEACFLLLGLFFVGKAGQFLGKGKSKTYLPNGKYRRLAHYFSDDHVFFYLIREDKKRVQPFSWIGEKAIILGRNGRLLKHYPERFSSKQGQIKRLDDAYKKNPRMLDVYYFFPIIEEEEEKK